MTVTINQLFGPGGSPRARSQVELSFGAINLKTGSMTIGNWLLDETTGKRESAVNSGQKLQGRRRYVQATNHRESGKGFTTDTVYLPEGSIVLVEARGSRGRGIFDRGAAVFLRLRNAGANWLINAKLPLGNESMLGNRFPVFSGRADILTWDEIRTLDLGVKRAYFENYMHEDEVEDCFDMHRLDPEISPRPNLVKVVVDGKAEIRQEQAPLVRRMRRRDTF